MTLPLLPDVEKAVIAYLTADADVAAITTNIQDQIAPPYPMLRIARVGGSAERRLDRPLLFLDAYGALPDDRPSNEKATLNLLARTAIAALRALADTGTVVDGASLSALSLGTVLQWLPDPVTHQGRYRTEMLINARAAKS